MLTIVIGALVAALATFGLKLAFPHSQWSLIFPFLAVFIGVVALLLRRVGKRIEPIVKEAEKHLLGGRKEMALKTLSSGLRWKSWHPLLAGQMRSQIGAIHYDSGKLDEAERELSHASKWPWTSPALLGCTYFKKRGDDKKMEKAFQRAISASSKEPLTYTLYAYCLNARGKRDEAVKVLERGLKKIPNDQRIQNNVELLKEGKKMKTAPYGDKWARFQLEGEAPVGPRELPSWARGYNPRPGFRQKPKRKR